MFKIIKVTGLGISWGCTISCLISMIGYSRIGNDWFILATRSFNEQVIASMIVGMSWSIPSLVYQNEKFSKVQQWMLHMIIGFGVFIPIAFYMEWFPKGNTGAVITSMCISIVSALIVWFCFYLYYRYEAKAINKELKDKQR